MLWCMYNVYIHACILILAQYMYVHVHGHVYDAGMPGETATAICCMTMGGVLERFPRLKVCFAHGGGAFPYTLGRIEHGHAVRPDLCALENAISPRSVLDQEPMVAEGSWYNLYYMYTQKSTCTYMYVYRQYAHCTVLHVYTMYYVE